MLARLQQGMVAAVLALALAWSAWAHARGLSAPVWLAGLVLLLAPHAPLLGLEFVLLAIAGRDPAAPRASAGQLLQAWEARRRPRGGCLAGASPSRPAPSPM